MHGVSLPGTRSLNIAAHGVASTSVSEPGDGSGTVHFCSTAALATTNGDFTHNHKLWVRKSGLLTYT
jgi:hypothetical protein